MTTMIFSSEPDTLSLLLKQRRDTLAENRVYRDRLQKIPEGVGRAHCFPGFSWNVAHPNQPNL